MMFQFLVIFVFSIVFMNILILQQLLFPFHCFLPVHIDFILYLRNISCIVEVSKALIERFQQLEGLLDHGFNVDVVLEFLLRLVEVAVGQLVVQVRFPAGLAPEQQLAQLQLQL